MSDEESEQWFGAEGTLHDMPILVRGRHIDSRATKHAAFDKLFVIDLGYDQHTPDGLPSDSTYDFLAGFEAILDKLEDEGELLLVFVETSNGNVRYFSYVKDVDGVASSIDAAAGDNFQIDFSADDDPDWENYSLKMQNIAWQ